jgi:predicted  nucleic acid-binding Zn-ribbon protein
LERVQALENARKKAEEEAAARKRAEEKQKQQAEEEARKKKEEKEAAASKQSAISSNESEVEFDSHLATIEVLSTSTFYHTLLILCSRSSQMYSRPAPKILFGRKLALS